MKTPYCPIDRSSAVIFCLFLVMACCKLIVDFKFIPCVKYCVHMKKVNLKAILPHCRNRQCVF